MNFLKAAIQIYRPTCFQDRFANPFGGGKVADEEDVIGFLQKMDSESILTLREEMSDLDVPKRLRDQIAKCSR